MKCGVADVGSNTIRLSIYQCEGEQVKLLLNKKVMAGLAGYIKNGILSDSGIHAACQALSGFRTLLDNLEVRDLYVFGTASLRNSSNAAEALNFIRQTTHLDVEVLTGTEEAELSFRGAALGGGVSSGLLADIGGGSTELVTFQEEAITSKRSVPLGSLSTYTRFVAGLFPTKEERKAMRNLAWAELKTANPTHVCCKHLLGVGGTIRAAAKLCNDLSGADSSRCIIPAQEVRALYKHLKKGDGDTLQQILRSTPDRVHTILPGLVILNAVLKTYQVETISVSEYGVREGYLLDRVIRPTLDRGEG